MYELNNLIEILTIQYTVTCKSVYKGLCPKLSTDSKLKACETSIIY